MVRSTVALCWLRTIRASARLSVSDFPCTGYQLRSMGLNATQIKGERVILATDFNQTCTGLPLTMIETHQIIDNSTPAPIPDGQPAPPLPPRDGRYGEAGGHRRIADSGFQQDDDVTAHADCDIYAYCRASTAMDTHANRRTGSST